MKKLLAILLIVVCSFTFQKSNYDYTLTIKVEGKSLEDSMRIKDELTKYCEKNRLAIEDYSKKEFEQIQKSRSMKAFK
jgi:hypothetical protein